MIWPIVKLGSVCKLINGDRGKNYPSKADLSEKGIPFINAGNLTDQLSIECTGVNFISQDRFDLLSNGKVQTDDILFCLRGSLGKFAIVDSSIGQAAIASSLVILRATSQIENSYLKNYLRSSLCEKEIDKFENGAAQPNLSARDLKEFEIPLPPLPEQRRIAAILDKADELRQKRRQAIDKLDQLLESVFLEMFGDPVTNSKSWRTSTLGDASTFENGDRSSNYPSGQDLISSGVLFLNTKNIVGKSLDYSDCNFISENKFASLSRGKLAQGDLVITLRGTLGACAIFRSDEYSTGFINAQMMIIRAGSEVLPDFVHAALTSKPVRDLIMKEATGAAVPQLTASGLKKLPLIIPPLDAQNHFVECAVALKQLKEKSLLSNASIEQMFTSIQQRAFNGIL